MSTQISRGYPYIGHVEAGTIVLWSDIACPWATLAVYRLRAARTRNGLDGQVSIDHRAFPLELVNARSTPRRILVAEVPAVGALAPAFGWQVWQASDSEWPVTTLPALEAVLAAKIQGLTAAEELDFALRRAFFGESRCIAMRHVVLDVAEQTPGVDADAVEAALDAGRAREDLIHQWRAATDGPVKGSPHLFLPDGTDEHNPGIDFHWAGEHGRGIVVIDRDDPSVYDQLVTRAAQSCASAVDG